MFLRKHPIIASLLTLIGLIAGYASWVFWPLIGFQRGQPVFYRLADIPSRNVDAAPIVIIGGNLVDGTGATPVENSVIVIQGQRIVALGKASEVPIPFGAVRIAAGGKTVLPGLIDMHVHLNRGDDLHLFLAAGVTSVRDVGNFTSQVVPLADSKPGS